MSTHDLHYIDHADLFEGSLNEIYIFDVITLKFVLVNRAARRNIGYTLAELRELTQVDITPEYSAEQFKRTIAPLLDARVDTLTFQTVYRRKDGSEYDVDVCFQHHKFGTQQVLVAFILDISKRVELDRELAFFQSLLESAPDAMVVADTGGHVLLANQQMQSLLGYSHEELLTMNVDDFVPPSHREHHSRHRKDFHHKPRVRGMGSELNLSAITKNGDLIPIEVSLSPVENKGEKMVAAAIRDVSQRKEIERKLLDSENQERQARQQAERATRTKSRFLAAASHDLRQPLQALRLYLSAMKSRFDDEKLLELSQKMHLSLDTMGELLESLLDISSLESGNITAEIQEISLKELVTRLEVANAPLATSKGLVFETNPLDLTITTDPALLERILENFISNAIRYTKQGSIELITIIHEDKVRISVIDSGIGIPKDALESVFEEYYQLDNDVRDRSKGLGLGLSIVKHLADILNHKVLAESNIGSGSCFSVDVPLGEANDISIPDSAFSIELVSHGAPDKVLVVDDDQTVVDAMAELLEIHGIDVEPAYSGVEALKKVLRGLRPTLIISDFRMPQLDGIETIKALREEIGSTVPVLIMTGDTGLDLIQQADLENLDILNKPISESTMLSVVAMLKAGPRPD